MQRIAFKMELFPGKLAEYKQRHDSIWPELSGLLKKAGISDYSIFVDESTNALFATMKIKDESALKNLANEPVMKKWWAYMKDLMETNKDDSPLTSSLQEVFYLQ
ncbi:MAG TPA: L-rhamnose mutarotase [Flavitalea sp.]|nr:L-rhamnose mutarotase [Flavitalea sp.]